MKNCIIKLKEIDPCNQGTILLRYILALVEEDDSEGNLYFLYHHIY
jgi:hypothetical protein